MLDATRDITEKDIARQRYIELRAAQAFHNATKKEVKENWFSKLLKGRK